MLTARKVRAEVLMQPHRQAMTVDLLAGKRLQVLRLAVHRPKPPVTRRGKATNRITDFFLV